MQEQNNDIIGLNSPEDTAYDNSYAKDFLDWMNSDKYKEVKTISWFEYESL